MLADVAGYYLGGTPTAAGTLGALPPSRILDTRTDGRGMVPGSSGRAVTVAGQGGVPAGGASAAILNVTVTDTTDGGFITVFPTGVNRPTASNLNFIAGQTVPNLVMVPIGTDGKIMLYNASTAPVDLVADVVGYVI
jgi:serine protease